MPLAESKPAGHIMPPSSSRRLTRICSLYLGLLGLFPALFRLPILATFSSPRRESFGDQKQIPSKPSPRLVILLDNDAKRARRSSLDGVGRSMTGQLQIPQPVGQLRPFLDGA